jgi:hypothetical protein
MAHRFLLLTPLSALLAMALVCPASAADYCTQVPGQFRQCNFSDPDLCRQRAIELKASCIANPDLLRSSIGSAPYCLIDSDRQATCIYIDPQACEIDAMRDGGECLESGARGR